MRGLVRAGIGALVLAMTALGPRVSAWSQAPAFDSAPALDRYEQGTAPAAAELSLLAAGAADGRLLSSLRTAGWDWMQAGGPAGIRGRRLILAALVLEAVSTQHDQSGVVATPVIEWACANLREADPLPAERSWQVATVALLQRGASRDELWAHLEHARGRFKDDPRLLFADAWLQRSGIPNGFRHNEMASTNPYFPSGPLAPVGPIANAPTLQFFPQRTAGEWFAVGMDPTLPGFTGGSVVDIPHSGTMPLKPEVGMVTRDLPLMLSSNPEVRLLTAKNDYKHARDTKALAAEAELRLGQLDLLYAKPKNASDHFASALDQTGDRDLRYLAYFLLGQAEQRQSQWAAACIYYHNALEANPNGRAAIDAWAGALEQMGLFDEMLAMRARVTDPAAADPWTAFSKRDLVDVKPLIEQLRKDAR